MKLIPPVPPEFRVKGPFEFFELIRKWILRLITHSETLSQSVTSAGGSTTITENDYVIIVTGASTQTLALPAVVSGKEYLIKNKSTGNVTVSPAGADTIGGTAASVVMVTGQFIRLLGNGSDWVTV